MTPSYTCLVIRHHKHQHFPRHRFSPIAYFYLSLRNTWQMVLPTTVTCFGVLVPFIIREYESADIAGVSWIPGIAVAVLNLTGMSTATSNSINQILLLESDWLEGPWVSAMLKIYSHRRLASIGSVTMVVAIIASSFANTMLIWYMTYGLLLGFGCSLSGVMGLLLTQEYFLQKRHMANGEL